MAMPPSAWSPAWRWTSSGPRKIVPAAAALVGIGALLFGTGDPTLARIGRFLQGAGGVFSLISAVYIATKHFPASRRAP